MGSCRDVQYLVMVFFSGGVFCSSASAWFMWKFSLCIFP